nr:hypothetical protein [Tanacetum cinerariifolium]
LEREFRSSRKLFKTPSLDELSSPEFDLFSNLEEHFKEEIVEGEAMKEYMCKTQGGDLVLQGIGGATRQILDIKGAIPTMIAANARVAIQEMAKHSQKWHDGMSTRTRSTKTSNGLVFIQAQLNHLGREIKKEIRAFMDAAIRSQGASIKALEVQIRQMSKVLQERGSRNLPSRYAVSRPQNCKLFFVPSQATIPFPSRRYDDCYDEDEGLSELKDLDAYSIGATLLVDVLPAKEKHPGSFTLPCIINNMCFNKALADLGASINVMAFSTIPN